MSGQYQFYVTERMPEVLANDHYQYHNHQKQHPQRRVPRPQRRVQFKEDYEERFQGYERSPSDVVYNVVDEDVNREAEEFIKMEHKKFQSRVMSTSG